jgi:hypothetical protein
VIKDGLTLFFEVDRRVEGREDVRIRKSALDDETGNAVRTWEEMGSFAAQSYGD